MSSSPTPRRRSLSRSRYEGAIRRSSTAFSTPNYSPPPQDPPPQNSSPRRPPIRELPHGDPPVWIPPPQDLSVWGPPREDQTIQLPPPHVLPTRIPLPRDPSPESPLPRGSSPEDPPARWRGETVETPCVACRCVVLPNLQRCVLLTTYGRPPATPPGPLPPLRVTSPDCPTRSYPHRHTVARLLWLHPSPITMSGHMSLLQFRPFPRAPRPQLWHLLPLP